MIGESSHREVRERSSRRQGRGGDARRSTLRPQAPVLFRAGRCGHAVWTGSNSPVLRACWSRSFRPFSRARGVFGPGRGPGPSTRAASPGRETQDVPPPGRGACASARRGPSLASIRDPPVADRSVHSLVATHPSLERRGPAARWGEAGPAAPESRRRGRRARKARGGRPPRPTPPPSPFAAPFARPASRVPRSAHALRSGSAGTPHRSPTLVLPAPPTSDAQTSMR